MIDEQRKISILKERHDWWATQNKYTRRQSMYIQLSDLSNLSINIKEEIYLSAMLKYKN